MKNSYNQNLSNWVDHLSCSESNQNSVNKDCKAYEVTNIVGKDSGWVYKHEILGLYTNIELFNLNLINLNNEIGEIEFKVNWMIENDVKVFDEEEFKVFQTISLLEDKTISRFEKSKVIAKLIKGNL